MSGVRFGVITLAAILLTAFPDRVFAQPAPDFYLQDAEGKRVALSDFHGRPLVLHFWATWCPYCKKLQPGLDKLAKRYKPAGLVVLGISFREEKGAHPQRVLQERGHQFRTLIDGDEVAGRYGVRGTPTTFFIDPRGQVLWVTNSSDPNDPQLEYYAQRLMGLPAPSSPQ